MNKKKHRDLWIYISTFSLIQISSSNCLWLFSFLFVRLCVIRNLQEYERNPLCIIPSFSCNVGRDLRKTPRSEDQLFRSKTWAGEPLNYEEGFLPARQRCWYFIHVCWRKHIQRDNILPLKPRHSSLGLFRVTSSSAAFATFPLCPDSGSTPFHRSILVNTGILL